MTSIFTRRAYRTCAGLLLVLFLLACTRQQSKPTQNSLNIAAAADLEFALNETIQHFKQRNPEAEVKVTYGSSGNFYTQIQNGAPFDMFLSADMDYPRKLEADGVAIQGTEFVYAVGRLAVWVPKASPIPIEQSGITSLLDPTVRHIAIANPQHAPYGRSAVAAMQKFGVYDRVKDKFVLGENVSQTLQFIASGSAEIGIIAMSLAKAPPVTVQGRYWEVPLDSYPRMEQGGVILNRVGRRDTADAFRSFLLGPDGQVILKQFGFFTPEEDRSR